MQTPKPLMILITSLLFGTVLSVMHSDEAFADTVTVLIPSGTSSPSCEQTDSCYDPSGMLVKKGDKVMWINKDTAAHTVTSGNSSSGKNGLFDSGMIMASYDFSYKFTETGNYDYFCSVHPWMKGNIVVFEIPEEPKEETTNNYIPPSQNNNYPTKNYDGYDEDSRINVVLSNRITTLNHEVENLKIQLESEKARADIMAVDKAKLNIMYDELEKESNQMKETISNQNNLITELKTEVKSLKVLVMEQLSVLNELFLKLSS